MGTEYFFVDPFLYRYPYGILPAAVSACLLRTCENFLIRPHVKLDLILSDRPGECAPFRGFDLLGHGQIGAVRIDDDDRRLLIFLPRQLIGHDESAHPLVGRSRDWAGGVIGLGIEVKDFWNDVPILNVLFA